MRSCRAWARGRAPGSRWGEGTSDEERNQRRRFGVRYLDRRGGACALLPAARAPRPARAEEPAGPGRHLRDHGNRCGRGHRRARRLLRAPRPGRRRPDHHRPCLCHAARPVLATPDEHRRRCTGAGPRPVDRGRACRRRPDLRRALACRQPVDDAGSRAAGAVGDHQPDLCAPSGRGHGPRHCRHHPPPSPPPRSGRVRPVSTASISMAATAT